MKIISIKEFDWPLPQTMMSNIKVLEKLKHIPASIIQNGEIKKHNTGVYFTDIPTHPFPNSANVDYKEAENRGYFKLDFFSLVVWKSKCYTS